LYFTANADFCHSSNYQNQKGRKKVFVAKVLVGKSVSLDPDHTLKVPPMDTKTNERFDSVKGNVNDIEVFMVYANKQAYPEYLLTYL